MLVFSVYRIAYPLDGVCILITKFLFLMSITVENKSQKGKNEKLLFCIMLKVLWNNTQIHSSIVALVIQQNNSKVPCFTLYTQLCTKNWRRKNTRSICPRAILSFSNILYYSLFTFHFKGRKSLYILLVTRNDGYQESCSAIYMSSK